MLVSVNVLIFPIIQGNFTLYIPIIQGKKLCFVLNSFTSKEINGAKKGKGSNTYLRFDGIFPKHRHTDDNEKIEVGRKGPHF